MTRPARFPVIFGVLALVCLFAGGWQIRQDQAAEARLDRAALAAAGMPDMLPDAPDPESDLFRPVRIEGTLTGDPILLPMDHAQMGPGFRVVQGIEVNGRRILIDRGFIYDAWRDGPFTATRIEANGNLYWPRNLGDLARQAQAAPVLVVAATPTGDGIVPLPVDPEAGRGAHMRFAILWLMLAALFAGVTVLAQWRIKRRDEGNVTQ